MELPVLKPMHTPCNHCLFATYGDDPEGKLDRVQVGCKLGRVDAFREQGDGDTVVSAYDAAAVGFFVINGRICNAFRPEGSGWASEHPDALAQVRAETELRMATIVVADEHTTEADLLLTAQSIVAQKLPPREVFFVNNGSGISMARFNSALMGLLGNKVTWRITKMTTKSSDGECVDQAVSFLKESGWYSVFRGGYALPEDFNESVHRSLNERMERFSLLRPVADGNGLVVQVAFHSHGNINGNAACWAEEGTEEFPRQVHLEGIVAKVEHYAAQLEQAHLVKDVAQVVPGMIS